LVNGGTTRHNRINHGLKREDGMMTRFIWACLAVAYGIAIAPARAEGPASLPGASAEHSNYDEGFREKFGDPPPAHAAEFMEEIRAGNDYTLDRDSRVLHLKKALALRPDDPANIAIEFCITIELSEHIDPKHHEDVRRKEGQEVAEHLIATYDHKFYYRDSPGGAAESPDYMVPQTAVWASEYASVFGHDGDKAQKYANVAMDDFYWTFQKRRAAWASAPRPATEPARAPDGFMDEGFGRGRGDSALQAWKQRKADAAAGNVMGYYAKAFSQAAVHAYVLAYAIEPTDEAEALQQVIAKYPNTPMSAAAAQQLTKMPPAPRQAPSPVAIAPIAPIPPAPGVAAVPIRPEHLWLWILIALVVVCVAAISIWAMRIAHKHR
jgi:hypothetical protein